MQIKRIEATYTAVLVACLLAACGQDASKKKQNRAPAKVPTTEVRTLDDSPSADATAATPQRTAATDPDMGKLIKDLQGILNQNSTGATATGTGAAGTAAGGSGDILASLQGLLNGGQSGLVAGSMQGMLAGGNPNDLINKAKQIASSGGLQGQGGLLASLGSNPLGLINSLASVLLGSGTANGATAITTPVDNAALKKIDGLLQAGKTDEAKAELQKIIDGLKKP